MGRPQSVSDEEILAAALRVIARRGLQRLTLTEVSEEAGLSRGAISLRFKNVKQITARLSELSLQKFQRDLQAIPHTRCGAGLIEIAAVIGRHLSGRGDATTIMRTLMGNKEDKALAALEERRAEVLRHAISVRIPKTALPDEEAVDAFVAHLKASILALHIEGAASAPDYLAEHAKRWLLLARVPMPGAAR